MNPATTEISHGTPLRESDVASYAIAPMLRFQVEKWCRDRAREPRSVRVLDYGCGRGRTVFKLRDLGFEAYGVDIDSRPIENGRILARARGLDAEQVLTSLDTSGRSSYQDDFFDLTSSFQVFEHVRDIDAAVRELARVTKPGGGGIHVFPPLLYPIEGHLSMPFVHWMPRGPLRYSLTRTWVALGVEARLSSYAGLDAAARAAKFTRFVDEQTAYRTCGSVARSFRDAGLKVRFVSIESPNVVRRLGRALEIPGARDTLNWVLSRFASIHLLYEKPESGVRPGQGAH